jgi:hypothetical protein
MGYENVKEFVSCYYDRKWQLGVLCTEIEIGNVLQFNWLLADGTEASSTSSSILCNNVDCNSGTSV